MSNQHIFNDDFVEFFEALNKGNVEYILIGGYSVILHGYPRTTGDLDIWVRRTDDNYNNLLRTFGFFGLPVFDMTLANFLNVEEFDVFRFGRLPMAIDIITSIKGLTFEQAYPRVIKKEYQGVAINYISYEDLITAKLASGRPRDINDIQNLEERKKR